MSGFFSFHGKHDVRMFAIRKFRHAKITPATRVLWRTLGFHQEMAIQRCKKVNSKQTTSHNGRWDHDTQKTSKLSGRTCILSAVRMSGFSSFCHSTPRQGKPVYEPAANNNTRDIAVSGLFCSSRREPNLS
jgi:hypothetical protein